MFLVFALVGTPFHAEPAIRAGQTLVIKGIQGDVRVRPGSRLVIDARKHADTSDPDSVVVRVDTTPDGVIACVRYPGAAGVPCGESTRGAQHNDTAVDFDVTVPPGVAVEADDVNGSVNVVAQSTVRANSVNGNVRVEAGDVELAATVNGSVHVQVHDRSTRRLRASSINGTVEIDLPAGSGVAVHAQTLNGEIVAGDLPVRHREFGPGASVDGVLGDGARSVELQSVNGSIYLRRG
jgi:hypothetical protein